MSKPYESVKSQIKNEVSETIELADKKEDIRLILPHLRQISMLVQIPAEISDDADMRFVSFVFNSIYSMLRNWYTSDKEEWYKLNQRNIEGVLSPLKVFVQSFTNAFIAGDFKKAIDTSKTFFYVAWKHTRMLTS